MKTLHILRHAKAEEGRGKADKERNLTDRGVRAATVLGLYLRQQNIKPDLILCSPASRTKQTMEHLLRSLDCSIETRFDEKLYHADPSQIADAIAATESTFNNVLLIGHNPGLQLFVAEKSKDVEGEGDDIDRIYQGFPTAALASLNFSISDWTEILKRGCKGQLVAYVEPSDLV
ncbi:MAG: histidine phosphatase family protein [Alphaproteobacteria bacterium]|nr:MAG: histidine phosphatase family protein [Alphaproteobacteria bacterium]